MSRKANLLLRLRAVLWCAGVAGVLCVGVLLFQHAPRFDEGFWFFVLYAAVPAGISGGLVGWHLLNPDGYHDTASVIGWGTAVVLLAYVVLDVVVTVQYRRHHTDRLDHPACGLDRCLLDEFALSR